MGLFFEQVLTAKTPDEAVAALDRHSPTFLLCDFWLGESFPPSTSLIPAWRDRCPSLRRVVLMSGTKSSSIPKSPAVDAIFPKPLDLKGLVAYLREAVGEAP